MQRPSRRDLTFPLTGFDGGAICGGEEAERSSGPAGRALLGRDDGGSRRLEEPASRPARDEQVRLRTLYEDERGMIFGSPGAGDVPRPRATCDLVVEAHRRYDLRLSL